ncbi:hypothetical protein DV736_g6496, partial [Chaetothyriales sp. CBS 134916]
MSSDKKFKCKYEGCTKSYRSAPNLKRHQLNHTCKTRYRCHCDRYFVRKDAYTQHRRRCMKLCFRDDTEKVVKQMQEVSTVGCPTWTSTQVDNLPPFTQLQTDEDRERKAERSRPGKYYVVINPESFSHLSVAASQTSSQSATGGILRLIDLNTVLSRFEEANPPSHPHDQPTYSSLMTPHSILPNEVVPEPAQPSHHSEDINAAAESDDGLVNGLVTEDNESSRACSRSGQQEPGPRIPLEVSKIELGTCQNRKAEYDEEELDYNKSTLSSPKDVPRGFEDAHLARTSDHPKKRARVGCSKSYLSTEKRHHHAPETYKCWVPGCPAHTFTYPYLLKRHLTTHGGKSCNQRNRYVATLDKNSKYYDPDWQGDLTEDGTPNDTSSKLPHEMPSKERYQCWVPGCSASVFTYSSKLKSHLETHGRRSHNRRNRLARRPDGRRYSE